ncbi:hypothetical protein ARMSODRAFT_615391 [Armillaria solidipes]|uniref:Uncharacterized protein n=1 Tax=Armillaria solidipes TaxID=1076256 RepID=A0A2H3BE32_9AGAR|nr:hypothetical protein ARMSODRAFT_615391 [Armillaria solidipes]
MSKRAVRQFPVIGRFGTVFRLRFFSPLLPSLHLLSPFCSSRSLHEQGSNECQSALRTSGRRKSDEFESYRFLVRFIARSTTCFAPLLTDSDLDIASVTSAFAKVSMGQRRIYRPPGMHFTVLIGTGM